MSKAEGLAAGEACKAVFQPTPGLTGRTVDSSGFTAEVILIFVSTVLHCDRMEQKSQTD